jgi:arylformamidase
VTVQDRRAVFDVRIAFLNGGGLTAEGFRLDVPDEHVSEQQVARLLVQHLGLALVADVRFDRFEIVAEQHKGSRGVVERHSSPAAGARHRIVDLSHPIRKALVEPLPGRDDAPDVASVELDRVVDIPAEVFHLADATERGIPASVFHDRDVRGTAVLLHTGWDRLFGTGAYREPGPFLREDGLDHLVALGAMLVGIDSPLPDAAPSEARRVGPNQTVFRAGTIPLIEHLTGLAALPSSGATFTAVPLGIEWSGTSPVRAFAKVPVATHEAPT